MVLSTNVMNIISKLVSVCLLEQNISIPAYFDVPLHTISGYSFLYIYIYVLLIKKKKPYKLLRVLKVFSLLVRRILKL